MEALDTEVENVVVVKTITFSLTEEDVELEETLTLAGVIASKLQRGDYVVDLDLTRLQANYQEQRFLAEGALKKLNRIKRIITGD